MNGLRRKSNKIEIKSYSRYLQNSSGFNHVESQEFNRKDNENPNRDVMENDF